MGQYIIPLLAQIGTDTAAPEGGIALSEVTDWAPRVNVFHHSSTTPMV
ncbi:hypothetical protein Y88_3634 [Novosphingobium nitrogenifigens DSM 19370]|uniref:Uncharacterized protein n=1 Tax=Novosphingobium nitrogenifigens DSM 19370 TaxID=983920 RepID=F1ZD81_9SPHN|nr:hypothetical protein Y88_3634 [Novosphingobium nitrogenifigens DSM 19370]